MAKKDISTRTKTITLTEKEGTFSTLFHRFKSTKSYNSEVSNLRQLLSNEKARLLNVIKTKKPASIYELAKLVGRDFKAVRQDIRLLERFGLVELISAHKNGRELLRPIVEVDKLIINVEI
ncbi:MAG: hypothetical protein WC438_00900 [Candidatus Pacearchaeota archaeon]